METHDVVLINLSTCLGEQINPKITTPSLADPSHPKITTPRFAFPSLGKLVLALKVIINILDCCLLNTTIRGTR